MLKKILRRLRYELIDAPRGRGRGWSADVWNSQFQNSAWDHLSSVDELGHYMIILGYVLHFAPKSPSLLDVGCGNGRLLELLTLANFGEYVGADISAQAVEKAKALNFAKTSFKVCSFEEWKPDQQYDLIIFNESLYYASKPCEVLKSFECGLKKDGRFIVSMHHYGNHRSIWRNIDRRYSVLAMDVTENSKAQCWTAKVLRPRT